MYKKIAVAYNESVEAHRALSSAIELARAINAELVTITVMADLPSYTAFASAVDPTLHEVLNEDRANFYEALQDKARALALEHGIDLLAYTVDGPAVDAIVRFLRNHNADLLVVGLHQHDRLIARLWSTVYELAQEAPCNVLGVR